MQLYVVSALPVHAQVLHAAALMDIADLEGAQLLAAETVVQQGYRP